MLPHLLLLALLSVLATADVTCPDGKVSCPDGKTCCYSSGSFACCDLLDDVKIVPGSASFEYRNTSETMSMQGPSYWDYCPSLSGKKICCDSTRTDCRSGSDCCTNSKCCYRGTRCCGNGQWCCTKPLKCGAYFMSCYSSALVFAPTMATLAAMVMACLASKFYFL